MSRINGSQLLVLTLTWPIFAQTTDSAGSTYAMAASKGEKTLQITDLYGEWNLVSFNACYGETGEVKDLRGDLKWTLVITPEDTMRVEIESIKFFEWDTKYDVKKKPVWIDITAKFPLEGNVQQPKVGKGLLRLQGDELLLHLGYQTRPSSFDQLKGLTSILIKCKRIK